MLDTLQKMSGITHKTFVESKTVTEDKERMFMRYKGEVTYTSTTKEVPVITYNDMAFISERNSIVFRAGDSPIWNRNETILPMSWRLFKDTIQHPGHDYTLQTIPTLSSALEFDVRKNQPDFNEMLNKRMAQANVSKMAQDKYKDAYGYSDYEMSQLDPDVFSDDVMRVINDTIRRKKLREEGMDEEDAWLNELANKASEQFSVSDIEENEEQVAAIAAAEQEMQTYSNKLYAGKCLSKEDLVSKTSGVQHSWDADIIAVYKDLRGVMLRDTKYFAMRSNDNGLYGVDGTPYIIESKQTQDDLNRLYNEDANDPTKRVIRGVDEATMSAEQKREFEKEKKNLVGYEVTDAFYQFLISFDGPWTFAEKRFESAMARRIANA